MCELFALSGLCPANVRIFLPKFAARGGGVGPHVDGWGIAFYQDRAALVIREAAPAWSSEMARFMASQTILSTTAISHVRKATGDASVALRNTQPFVRELAGRDHVFAHNGDVSGVLVPGQFPLRHFHPVGETDSEHAFCYLLDKLHSLWRKAPPPVSERIKVIRAVANRLTTLGPSNFLYGDGEYLYAYSHRRLQGGKPPPRPPGLHWLIRNCQAGGSEIEGGGIQIRSVPTRDEQKVILVASVPLTDEPWEVITEGSLLVLRDGCVVSLDAQEKPPTDS
jgi:predicted glutamine amidotransferase